MLLLSLVFALHAPCPDAADAYHAALSAIVASSAPPSFTQTVLSLEAAREDFDDALVVPRLIASAGTDPAQREAAALCVDDAERTADASESQPGLAERIERAARGARDLDASDRALLARWRVRLRRAGAQLRPQRRRELLAREDELRAIERAFAAGQDPTLLARAVAARDRIAHLLGCESWTDLRVAQTHLTSATAVHGALATMLAETVPLAAQPPERALDPSFIAPYLPLDRTLDRVLACFAELFAVRIEPLEKAGWAPEVRGYRVRDAATNAPIGELYLDLFRRDGKDLPDGGFALLPVRVTGVVRNDPAAAVSASWEPPPRRGRFHLTQRELVELFGGIGDAFAVLFARTPYETLNALPPDFARVPGATFANLAWEPNVLARIALDDRGAPMPDALEARLLGTRAAQEARERSEAALLAQRTMALYASGTAADVEGFWAQSSPAERAAAMSGGDALLFTRPFAMRDGATLFAAFASSPLDPATAERFRTEILEPARSDDPRIGASRFLGRPFVQTGAETEQTQ